MNEAKMKSKNITSVWTVIWSWEHMWNLRTRLSPVWKGRGNVRHSNRPSPVLQPRRSNWTVNTYHQICHLFEQNSWKYKILVVVNIVISDGWEAYNLMWYCFLINGHQFIHIDKSVNFICFLYDYFQAVSSEAWRQRKKSWNFFLPIFQKLQKPTVAQ